MLKNSKIPPGSKVGVLGLGVTGKAAVLYVQACGASAFVSDNRAEEQFLAEEKDFLDSLEVPWEAGGHTLEFLGGVDLILISPGINTNLPILQELKDAGVRLAGELAVAAGHLEHPVIGISGTNGKTTVTTLVGNICRQAGKKVFVGGNIGNPLYYYLLHPEQYNLLVLELSSFQLDCSGEFAPDIGILLNITPDHVSWHGSMHGYIKAKQNLFINQGAGQVAIVNGDDPLCRELASSCRAKVFFFGRAPDRGCVVDDSRIIFDVEGRREDYPYKDFGEIQGVNRMNFAAAILAARLLGLDRSEICRGLQSFQFLPHRLEYVDTVAGVDYFNDSKATNTGAVIGALAQFEKKVVLIAGGRDKGDDFSLLRDVVAEKAEAVVLIGEAADVIAEAIAGTVPVYKVHSLEEAVVTASTKVQGGGVVLLSPGCASFDMFRSYGHRGDEFKKTVAKMKATGGIQRGDFNAAG